MKQGDLSALADVTALAFQREQAHLQPILAEESRIRRALAQLDSQAIQIRAQPESLTLMRPCGADVAWQSWEGRTRRQLNMQLAQVLAQKMERLDRVRRAFGKTNVAETLQRRVRADQARRAARAFEQQLSTRL